ncbi:MAG: SGNH/GDSL hydrolase family protein [Acidobacteria bacterium]|nr:SGNH/GDSL hydrolase family protein [Acidobacteriota bacterium]MDA1233953.1 SGNH/GDSL hydrolase family protein [Acidobacteriota bacterium]
MKSFLPLLLLLIAAPAWPQAPAPRAQPTAEQIEARRKAEDERLRNDWAQLRRYHEANAELLSSNPLGPPRVVFMGDSITDAWPRRSEAFFSGTGNVGRGISGQTTPQMLVRFQQDVVALKPEVVVINAGTNDIAGNTGPSTIDMITDNLRAMTQLAEAAGIKVVLASITPAWDYPWRPGLEPVPKVAAVNQWMKGYCEGHGCVYADYHSAMSDEKGEMKEGLSTDGIHPNEAGYAIMEPIARAAIEQASAR